MATVAELVEKVEKAKEKVNKCRATIERHKKQLDKKAKVLIESGINPDGCDTQRDRYQNGKDLYWDLCDYTSKLEDIKGANNKLRDAEIVLNNWNQKLQRELRMQEDIEKNTPEVIKVYMEKWKERAFDWHVKRYADYIKLKKDMANKAKKATIDCINNTPEYEKYRGKDPDSLYSIYPSKYLDEWLKKLELDYRSIRMREASFAGYLVSRMEDYRNEKERLAFLNKTLEEDKKNKIIDFMQKVTHIVGKVTDARGLSIGDKGEINGFIIGTQGKASIETIGAGGYNIQCFHFRTLIKEIK